MLGRRCSRRVRKGPRGSRIQDGRLGLKRAQKSRVKEGPGSNISTVYNLVTNSNVSPISNISKVQKLGTVSILMHSFKSLFNLQKGTGGMKLAGDFLLPFSYFLSDHHDFSHIRVAMCYSWISIKENFKNWIFFATIFAYFAAKHGYFWLLRLDIALKMGIFWIEKDKLRQKNCPFYIFFLWNFKNNTLLL